MSEDNRPTDMSINHTEYDDNSIDMLEGIQRIREKIAVMLGTSGIEGARHTVHEIIGNVLDEASDGYGKSFDVTYHTDNAISVRDYGRGVPLGWNERKQQWNWYLIYCELYAGGKYQKNINIDDIDLSLGFDNIRKQYKYLCTVGTNGLGAASVQGSSKYFEVYSYRNGVCRHMSFEHGVNTLEELEEYPTTEPNGTLVKWLPDEEIFSETNVGGDWLLETCKDIVHVSGLDLHFKNEQTGLDEVYKSGGLNAILEEISPKRLSDTIFEVQKLEKGYTKVANKTQGYICNVDIRFTPVSEGGKIKCYHNSTKMNGGIQYTAIQSCLSKFYTDIASGYGLKLEFNDYNEAMSVVLSSYSNIADYRGQTKDEVTNTFIYDIIYSLLDNKLNVEYSKGNKLIAESVEKVIERAKLRIQIREYQKQVRSAKKMARERVDKFISCHAYDTKDSAHAELWITEGDSAKTAVEEARNSDFQAIFPIIGKVLNVLKASLDRILANTVIRNIFTLLGTGMDLGVEDDLFDIRKLRFDKIIFATDADTDGAQIRVLLFLIFYKLAPQLIKEGHIYIARPPLYEVRYSNGSVEYAYSDIEKEELVSRGSCKVSRFKGLGSTNPKILKATTLAPETRRLSSLKMDLAGNETAEQIIDVLFGKDVTRSRKKLLSNLFGTEVTDSFEQNELAMNNIENDDTIETGIEYTDIE